MNLSVDIGNTRIKLAIFEQKSIQQFFVFENAEQLKQSTELKKFLSEINKVIISNVSNQAVNDFFELLLSKERVYYVSSDLPLPFSIDYETPHTLGHDRIAAVAGAVAEFDNDNVLIIDFGTCIKYNILSKKVFKGGAISPGLQMRYYALHQFTGKLPLLNSNNISQLPELIGKNTNDNIHSGVINGIIFEINQYIDKIKSLYSNNLKIVFTGGDANFFQKVSERKVLLRPYLILNGLNEILEYQK